MTTPASGSAEIRFATPAEIVCCGPWPGERPRGWTVRSRRKLLSNSSSIEFRKLAPRLLMPTTSARPIISAVAVAAVRAGFDRAESAAIRPSTGASRRTGHDSVRVSGSIRNGAIRAIPKKIAIVPPIPAATTGVVVSSEAPSRNAPARPGTIIATPDEGAPQRRAVAQALGAEHRPDRRDAAGPARGVQGAEQRGRRSR